jgi:glycyl-tRNA synthetase beta chain
LPDAVAAACQDHYSPLGPSDDVPSAPVSVTVALADKLDTLAGFWAIDEKPTGSKDPFALRRAALGVIRLVLENNVRLSLSDVIAAHLTQSNLSQTAQDLATDLMAFFHDRLKVFLRDQGIRYDVIEACLSQGDQTDLVLIVERAKALAAVLETDDGINLVQGFKRANNILTQAEQKDGVEYSFGADIKFAEEEVERQLFAALETTTPKIQAALQAQDFAAAMADMAMLRAPIDAFFDGVQVNSDNAIVRRNRLNMLHSIRDLVGQVADLNRIEG